MRLHETKGAPRAVSTRQWSAVAPPTAPTPRPAAEVGRAQRSINTDLNHLFICYKVSQLQLYSHNEPGGVPRYSSQYRVSRAPVAVRPQMRKIISSPELYRSTRPRSHCTVVSPPRRKTKSQDARERAAHGPYGARNINAPIHLRCAHRACTPPPSTPHPSAHRLPSPASARQMKYLHPAPLHPCERTQKPGLSLLHPSPPPPPPPALATPTPCGHPVPSRRARA